MLRLSRCYRNAYCGMTWLTGVTLLAMAVTTLPAAPPRRATASSSARKPAVALTPAQVEFFEKRIRPILAESCFSCHAKPAGSAGGLRLDSLAGMLKGGRHGAAIVPGKPEQSLLVEVIGYEEKIKMPPTGKLTDEKVAALTEWIKMGAPWPGATGKAVADSGSFSMRDRLKHWAWQPIRTVTPPTVKNTAWVRNPIDRFLLAKLEAKGLAPAKPVEKRVWLRRVTYGLIGLPPTPAEMEAFLADRSPNAYEKVVERLLASPHYGERWARHWLDLARYAETDGHEFDFDKPGAFHYRDYVIRAFNADVPYDRFVREHLAGDLLPEPRIHPTLNYNESLLATGFWWLGEGKHSPVDILGDQAERVDNQIDVFSKTFLGLSVGCARCHDHKFDAITTKDYYALSGYIKSMRYQMADVRVWTMPERQTLESLRRIGKAWQAALKADLQSLGNRASADGQAWSAPVTETRPVALTPGQTAQEQWQKYLREVAANNPNDLFHAWAALAKESPQRFPAAREALAKRLNALVQQTQAAQTVVEEFSENTWGKWTTTGEAFGRSPQAVAFWTPEPNSARPLVGLMGTGVADSGAVSNALCGALRSPTFILSKPQLWFRMAGNGVQARLVIDHFQRIRYPIYGGLELHINAPEMRWFGMDVSKWIGHPAYIEFLDNGPGRIVVDRIVASDGGAPPLTPNSLLAQRLSDPALTTPQSLAGMYQNLLRESLHAWNAGEKLTPAQVDILNTLLRIWPGLTNRDASETVRALAQQRQNLESALPEPIWAMASMDGTPENDRVHIRGSYKTLGEVVPRRNLAALQGEAHPAPAQRSGRLELAEHLVSPANPLVARVLVNRVWHYHFGAGLVRTPDDFGFMGERPTHPELLDWLAGEFMRQGWSLKNLHRLMTLSSAYRMASQSSAKAEEADPTNRWWHRMSIRRLEAEAIRDGILAVSGRLDRTLYGPSVLPHLTPFMNGRGRPGSSGPLDGNGRRSIYLSVRRNFLTPMFMAFDYPVPFTTIGRRTVSNVPAQALALMNNPFVVQQARLWAERTLAEPNREATARLRTMYVEAFGREPTSLETQAALNFLASRRFAPGSPEERDAWADLAHVLFNVKEFIFLP